jgi:dipeptidyl aminopeptidase/acylaminoacyl peptidase
MLSTPDIPSDVFLLDGEERRLTALNAELLDEVSLHEPRSRTFIAPDGTQLHGWVIRGDGDGAQPLLVDIHGGPHNAWNPAWNFASIQNEILASQGWSILLLNPRASDGYGEDFYRAAIGGWGERDEGDFLAAIDALVEDGGVDPERVAATGYSYGGYMTNWLTARTDRFKAAVTGGCVTNKTSVFGTSDIGPLLGAFEIGAELRDAPDRFVAVSPLTYAKDVTTPTLILHGEADDRCPVSQAEEWFAALKRLGTEVEFVRYPGGSHLFPLLGRPSHRADYVRRVVDWVTKHTT